MQVADERLRCFVGLHQCIHRAELSREVLRGRFADVPDTQRVDDPGERRPAALVDRGDYVRGGFVRHPLELGQRGDAELVQIGRRVDDVRVDELVDELVAQAFDVHRATAREVQ